MTAVPAAPRRPGRKPDQYQGLTRAAKQWLGSRHGTALAAMVGVTGTSISQWKNGRAHPSYAHACALLARGDGLTLEDFGYTQRPDGRVARLLAIDVHAPPLAFVRVSSDARCGACGRPYHRHPRHVAHDYLHQACDGRLVKL